jgi:Uma2 family endonuclease
MNLVARVPPFDRPATYDDLVRLPEHLVAEIVNGELHASARPALPHARVGARLAGRLVPPFDEGRGGPGGWVILYAPELHLGPEGRNVVVPDWAGWRRNRMPQVPPTAFTRLAPDWVCEILSSSTASLDRAKKLDVYAREGTGHAWLIDPIARTVEVLRLEEGRWTILSVHSGDDLVRAEPFGEVEIPLATLWT